MPLHPRTIPTADERAQVLMDHVLYEQVADLQDNADRAIRLLIRGDLSAPVQTSVETLATALITARLALLSIVAPFGTAADPTPPAST